MLKYNFQELLRYINSLISNFKLFEYLKNPQFKSKNAYELTKKIN